MVNEDLIKSLLSEVNYPGFSRDIVSFGVVKNIELEADNSVKVFVSLSTRDPKIPQQLQSDIQSKLIAHPDIASVVVDFDIQEPAHNASAPVGKVASSIPGVKAVVAVASGKGGVGKSTVSTNLAIALAESGLRVGLCDCDLYGPSIPLMMGCESQSGQLYANEAQQIIPTLAHGVVVMSMGLFLQDDAPVIVRGPMATRYTQQFLQQVAWDHHGELDVLLLDLPPGTGDIQLTIVQTIALDGAVLVTTPQEIALIDARKAASMFAKVNVPILGVVENMSYFISPSDGEKFSIFGEGGGQKEAERLGVDLLGKVPIEMPIGTGAEQGTPIMVGSSKDSSSQAAFGEIALRLKEKLADKFQSA